MNQNSLPTRLVEYIKALLPDAHGHQIKATIDFVLAIISVRSCSQAALARSFDNFEAAKRRLTRWLHNPRLDPSALACGCARMIVTQLPLSGPLRISFDWTIEDTQHLLVASLGVGRRAIPLFWKAFDESQLKDHRSAMERGFVQLLFAEVLCDVTRRRFIVTADRGFADVAFFEVLDHLGISFIIRTKSSTTVRVDSEWRQLTTLRMSKNRRRRSLGRLWYCATDPRRYYVVQSRARDRHGKWGIWHLISNRPLSAFTASAEYARRFGGEEGFRDAKRLLGFADANIDETQAWQRMFTLVAIALLVMVGVGCRLIQNPELTSAWLRQVCSRRKTRGELSLVHAIAELLKKHKSLWELLCCRDKLNLEAHL